MARQSKRVRRGHSSRTQHAGRIVSFLERCHYVKRYSLGEIDGRRKGSLKKLSFRVLKSKAVRLGVFSDGSFQKIFVYLYDDAEPEKFHTVFMEKFSKDFTVVFSDETAEEE